ncbi:MAG: T9SS type A sorting domain-containing protein [Bacteroidetes bacterium]|nr:T9SS type A sorting domain-containing protein [Bacteroidota bacterium]
MKHLKLVICSIVVLYCSNLLAQEGGILLLDNTYYMTNTIKLSDGNFAGIGYVNDGGTVKAAVVKFEPDNDIIWQTILGAGLAYNCKYIYSITPDEIIALNGKTFYKLNSSGTIISEIAYAFDDLGYAPIVGDLGVIEFIDADTNSTGMCIVGQGSTGAPTFDDIFSVTQISNDGEVLWSYGYLMTGYTDARAITATDLTSTIIYAAYSPTQTNQIIIENATGDLVDNELPTPTYYPQLCETNNGTIHYGVNFELIDIYDVITRLDDDGAIIYNKSFLHPLNDSTAAIVGVTQLPDNTIVSCNLALNIPLESYDYVIKHYNEAGDITYVSPQILSYGSFKVIYFASIDDQLVFSGLYWDGVDLNIGFTLLTDALGNFNKLMIAGEIYYDENDNGLLDIDEIPLPNVLLQTAPATYNQYSDIAGLYQHDYYFYDTYIHAPVLPEYWDEVNPENYTVTHDDITTGTTISDLNFGLQYFSSVTELITSIDLLNGVRPGTVSSFMLSVNNKGNQTIPAGNVEFHFSNLLEYLEGSPYETLVDTTITFAYPELNPMANQIYFVYLNGPIDLELGTPVSFSANADILPEDIIPTNNIDSINTIVSNSYDPNDKKVDPQGSGPLGIIDPATQYLEYTITFQNIGTAPAINVLVSDTLDAVIDPYSIQMLAATHPYRMELVGNNIINWHFDNINLPDSISNPLGSIGSVVMRVKLVPDLPLETQITNTANIYFDYNSPIITNTTINTLSEDLLSVNNQLVESLFNVFPNPVGDVINVSTTVTDAIINCTLYNITGVNVGDFNVSVNNGIFTIPTQHLPAGTYTIGFKDTSFQNMGNVLFIKL